MPWLVKEVDGQILGYAYATKWRVRPAYRRAVEVSVYIDKEHTGKGIGKSLYASLLISLKENGFHTAIGGIALPNESSVALHTKMGFKKVAHFEEVGFKFNQCIDVGYWQKHL